MEDTFLTIVTEEMATQIMYREKYGKQTYSNVLMCNVLWNVETAFDDNIFNKANFNFMKPRFLNREIIQI